jgi:hypothetical protein
MRILINVIILTWVLILSSCDKYPFLPDDYSEKFIGDWNWTGTSCLFGGSYLDADSVNYSIRLVLDRDGKYYYYKNDVLIVSSHYKFQFDYTQNSIRYYNMTIDNDTHTYFAIILNSDNKEMLVTGEKNPDTCNFYWERK